VRSVDLAADTASGSGASDRQFHGRFGSRKVGWLAALADDMGVDHTISPASWKSRILSGLLVGILFALLVLGGCGVDSVDPFTEDAPQIKGVEISRQFSAEGLLVEWGTDQPATTRLDYMTPDSMTNTILDRVLKHEHSVVVSDITSPANYVLDIQATNERGMSSTLTVLLPRTSPVVRH